MKFFVLPPLSNLELMDEGTGGHFCLAHLYVSNEEYRNHFLEVRKRENSFILLDNGAAENSLVNEDTLIEIVKELKPDEVIAPDVIHDSLNTVANLITFVERMKVDNLLEHTNIFFCPQGQDMEDWLYCYLVGLNIEEVSTIGLSKIALPHCMFKASNDTMIASARFRTVKGLHSLGLIRKPLHLLGAETPLEFLSHPVYNEVRSTDSCFTVWGAMNGHDWEDSLTNNWSIPARVPTPHDYFDLELTEEARELALKNINFLKSRLPLDS